MSRLGVLGWPVAHSRSPVMHNAALHALGLADGWRYQLLPVPPELFEQTVHALPQAGFRGVNVTIPHKHAALALADQASARAQAIGAANTLIFDHGEPTIIADNTDAPALIAALEQLGPVTGSSALVLGAGGSARAAVWALLDAGAREVAVWNRTPQRARQLCAEIGGTPVPDGVVADVRAELLVNCTSVGLDPADTLEKLSPLSCGQALGDYRVVVDLVYASAQSPLVRAAALAGAATVDGLELLVGQGALSFEQFTGLAAPVEVMRAAVGL